MFFTKSKVSFWLPFKNCLLASTRATLAAAAATASAATTTMTTTTTTASRGEREKI